MNKKQSFKAINRFIRHSSSIFIMGHKDLDLDAIGSALAIYQLCLKFKKKAYIILDDTKHEAGVQKILDIVRDTVIFLNSSKIEKYKNSNSLLVVVDVNKSQIMQNEKIFSSFRKTVVIDHHDLGEDSVSANILLIDKEISSTSELVTEFLYFYNYPIPPIYATFLLAGITLDTNNFTSKTNAKTHYAASYLIRHGASVKDVNVLLKQDLEEYILRQKVITDLEVLDGTIAFAKGSNRICYKREELAKIADTLLEFNHIETSYVMGKLSDKEIGISARSIGTVNIGEVLEKLGGGGDQHDAACRISGKTLKEVEEDLKKVLGEMK